METRDRKQTAVPRRYRPPGVIPLELWDLEVATSSGHAILWDHMRDADFGAVLRQALLGLRAGQGRTRSDGAPPACVHQFSAIYLTGGGAAGVARVLADGPWKLLLAPDADHPGDAGGHALLEQHGLQGWVLDLGQSALKISTTAPGGGLRHWRFGRDLKELPIRDDGIYQDQSVRQAQRAALRAFIGGALRSCMADSGSPPGGLVMALPSRLDDAGVPEGSSYIGMGGDGALVADSLLHAALGAASAWVLNDAELAAASAQLHLRSGLPHAGKTLVLTLGFGVGAALLE